MDGTLVDSTAVVEAGWGGFAERYGLDLAAVLAHAHGRPTRETVRAFAPPYADLETIVREFEEQELVRVQGVVEVPGAAAFVASVPSDSIAIVTSAPADLLQVRMEAAAVGLPRMLVVSTDVERGKPAPDPYLRAAQLLGVAPQDALVFEDSDAGIRSALAAGMQTVVVGSYRGPAAEGLPAIRDFEHVSVSTSEGWVHLTLTES